jgi:hypothetical protein
MTDQTVRECNKLFSQLTFVQACNQPRTTNNTLERLPPVMHRFSRVLKDGRY